MYCSMSLLDLWNNFSSKIHQFSIVVNGSFCQMMVENQWNTDATYSWVLLQLPLIITDSLVDTAKVSRKHHCAMNFATLGGNLGRAKKFLTVKLCSRSCRWREEIFHFLLLQYLSFLEYDIKAKTHWFVLFYFVTQDIACISRNHAT